MLPSEFAPLLYRQLVKIATPAHRNPGEQMVALAGLMERIFFEATKQEQIAFSTLFARISYTGHKFNIEAQTLRRIHQFRLAVKWVRNGSPATEQGVQLGLRAVAETVLVLTGIAIPSELLEHLGDAFQAIDNEIKGAELTFAASVRVVALEDYPEHQYFLASDEDDTGRMVRVLYGLPDRNENFMPSIQVIRKVFGFPVTLRLLEVDVDAAGHYRPRAFVVEPDYLVDVSSISECFKDTGPDPYSYLVKKFLPYESTEPILLGNIANFFLDRLLNNPAAEWQTVFRDTFQLYPFVYAPMSDAEVKTVARKAQKHFVNLKNMAASGLAKEGIEPENCFLEPSFYSEQYGIQGRLDLFYRTENKAAIVELKSGTPFKPNSYGIQRSHFTQTLLYDLLVRSVYGRNLDPAKYILYSGVDLNHLRFAPTVAPEQWEALQLRNQLLALERLLAKIQPGEVYVPAFGRLRASQGKGFTERDYGRFETAYGGLNDLEKKYFNAFAGFIAREHWLSKAGEEGTEGSNGHAALWRSSFEEKQQTFTILSHLEILENHADQAEPCITFKKTNQTNPLANFRVGDIAVLHPALETTDTVLQHQVMKCTLTELGKEHVTVQLRFQQHNLKPFESEGFWCLEPDLMDSGFAAMYRGLLEWAEAGKEKRALLLGMEGPFNPTPDGRGDTPPWAFGDNFTKSESVQFNPTPDPSPDGRGDTPPKAFRDNFAKSGSVQFNPTPDPSPDGRGDTPPGAFGDNVGKSSSVQFTPDPSPDGKGGAPPGAFRDNFDKNSSVQFNPSPDGRGDTPPKAFSDNFTKSGSVQSTEHTTAPLPSGEGSGVGLTESPPPKTGSFGQPEETASLERWRYLKNFARLHRKFPTDAEKSLWHKLRDKKFHGIKFRRQHAIDEFIADFVSLELRLVIEVDGDIHALQPGYDEQRTEFLNWFGFEVVRFSNDEVLNDMSGVLKTLKLEADKRKGQLEEEVRRINPTPNPSPDGRGDTPPKALSDNFGKSSLVQFNPSPAPSPDGRGDTPPKALSDNFGKSSSVQFNPTPDPSPDGRGDTPPKALSDNFGKNNSVQSTEHPTAPLPSGEGSGVGLTRITHSKNYFLLWGPPGTGKTSVVLRDLAAWVLDQTADNLLLLAYTNRAVDEICEALDSIGGDIRSQYLRIGAKFSTAERFRPQLLNTKIAGAANRADLRAVLDSHRIFVSTVASFSQNEGLLKLKKFQRLIVDEASQILEPQLIGLLTRFDHFILIGDHRQLPAVTTQRPETTTVHDQYLNNIGLCDLRDSYFERLYRRCMDQGWYWAYGQLDRQGRMHTEIMDFPNRYFYEGKLKTLSPEAGHYQQLPLNYTALITDAVLEKNLMEKRVLFLGIPPEENLVNPKTSRAEAELTARIVLLFKQLWAANGKEWHPAKTLGIITPWRAQIAQLRASLADAGLDPDEITIDTVERYQGGAREIIIVSTCVHSEYQLASLVNLSGEGVDRKMNVALTRAREHLILIGNEEILRKDERYGAFIEQYRLEIGK